ncbi:MAG: HPr family phosphocarrier protein [Lachnospiraceae bacterium]|nr:HPr family phosphocarrier protein [Lachnospiraceae bacterium]MDE6129571.1 HPr family phosphocarrier protein [Lachnospiraceae bacterium]
MKKETVTINLENGLEATPAAMLVQVASRYNSTVYIQSEDGSVRVNAKSIMGMMSLGLNAGECVVVEANGVDEKEAVDNIERYLTGKAAS